MHRTIAPWNRNFFYDLPLGAGITVGTTPVRVAIADDMRVTLIFSQSLLTAVDLSTAFIYISPFANITTANGILVPKSIPLVFTAQCHGQLVCQEWWAVATVAAQNLSVIQQRMKDWPEDPQLNPN